MRRPRRRDAALAAATATVFAALGDELRLRLVARLSASGPLSIARLAAGELVTRQAVSKHLQVLARAGVARSRRAGREQRWTLEPSALVEARRHLEQISARWGDALSRLKAAVEERPD